jgi:uncharacterized hydrophobic protein (TIGR00341 family)
MDTLEDRFGASEGFRLVLLGTEAVLPRPEAEEAEGGEEEGKEEGRSRDRISREELYADVTEGLRVSPTHLAMAGLSAVVAAVGLLRDDVAVVIGAMVIAPLLRPNVALALASTLADRKLAWKAVVTNAAGSALALVLAVGIGLFMTVDPSIPAIASRSVIDYQSLVLALAAGAAGTLAFTRGLAGAVIGVMVAVALLPPLVSAGLLLGAGYLRPAMGAFLLTAGNLISINLAGVVTFLLQGVRPRSWWQAERAKKAALRAAGVWLVLLLVLLGLVALGGELGLGSGVVPGGEE